MALRALKPTGIIILVQENNTIGSSYTMTKTIPTMNLIAKMGM